MSDQNVNKKNWFMTHKKATIAITGTVLIWLGLCMLVTLPYGFIATGGALLVGTLLTYLE